MISTSRREFLKTTSALAATAALPGGPSRFAFELTGKEEVRVWRTSSEDQHKQLESLQWGTTRANTPVVVALDLGAMQQEILGFGAALTDASCYVLSRLPDVDRQKIMLELFSPEQMALNVCQCCIGASDYSRLAYSYDESDVPDPALTKFSIAHDEEYILPMLRATRELNPHVFLFSAPWSPPGWMKTSGSLFGGSMRKRFFDAYARYFLKFLEAYRTAGIHINAVAVQNELDTDQDGNMPACLWGQEYEIQFVKEHLGPLFETSGVDTKIWILDHNYNLWGRVFGELSDSDLNRYVDGVAWHGYSGAPSDMTRVHNAFPDKNNYWTEGGPDITAPDYLTDWAKWADTFNGVLRNWSRSITAWNLALDEKGEPKIGPFSCGGLITVDHSSGTVRRSGQYWAFSHYSRHIQRGARVFRTVEASPGKEEARADQISHIGVLNPDGSCVVVLANRGARQTIRLALGQNSISLQLPADSVYTLQWPLSQS